MHSQIHFHFYFFNKDTFGTPLGIFNGFYRMKAHFF